MKLRVSMAYMAMLAMALGRIKQNKADQMRSLVLRVPHNYAAAQS